MTYDPEKQKEYNKKYREENKEKIKERSKKYREENKEKMREYKKKYNEENKEKVEEWRKKYYQENKEKIKEYNEENKEKIKARRKKYREENKEKLREYNKKYNEENKERYMASTTKHRAKKKNIPYDIDEDYLKSIWPEDNKCPALGLEFSRTGEGLKSTSLSLDRLVPELGYVKGNVAIVSMLANRIMTDATPDQVIAVGNFFKNKLENKNV